MLKTVNDTITDRVVALSRNPVRYSILIWSEY